MAISGVNLGRYSSRRVRGRLEGVRVLNFSQTPILEDFHGNLREFEARFRKNCCLCLRHLPFPKHLEGACDRQDVLPGTGERMNTLTERTLDRHKERECRESRLRPKRSLVDDGETETPPIEVVRLDRHTSISRANDPDAVAPFSRLETERRSAVLLEERVVRVVVEHIRPLWRGKFINFSPENEKNRRGCDRRTVRASDATHNPPATGGFGGNYLIFAHLPNCFLLHNRAPLCRFLCRYIHWYWFSPTRNHSINLHRYLHRWRLYVGEKNSIFSFHTYTKCLYSTE